MVRKKTVLIPIIMACVLAGQLGTVFADDYVPHLEVSVKNIYLAAGRQGKIAINLSNGGTIEATEVEATLASSTPGLSILSGNHKVFNEIPAGENKTYEAILYVDQGLSVGSYTLTLQLCYVRQYKTVSVNVPVNVVVNEPFQSMLKFVLSPGTSSFKAGTTNPLDFSAVNISNETLKDLRISLSSTSLLTAIIGDVNFNENELDAGVATIFTTALDVLDSASLGSYSVSGLAYYSDVSGNRFRQSFTLPFDVSSLEPIKTPTLTINNMNPLASVTPGQSFDLDILVTCSNADAFNVRASAALDQKGVLSPQSPLNVAMGDIEASESVPLKYSLMVDGAAAPGQIPVIVTLRYTDSKGVQGTSTETMTVIVDETVDFSLLNDLTLTIKQGGTKQFEGDLLLIGTSRVDFVRVSAAAQDPFIQVTGSSEYLGAIDPDSPVPFTINFGVKAGTALGDYTLPIRIKYMNHRNQIKEGVINVPVTVVEPQTATQASSSDIGFWGWLRQILGLGP
jgi:hypothetical protein